jgi:AcrR family transcriptional regulator
MSTPRPPKRQRGFSRVAAILDAASEIFVEKGFGAATMTEIAARSKTAIGSLYRFFPSKDALAEALMEGYAARLLEALDQIAAKAEGMTPRQLADALVAYRLELKARRKAAFALLESASGVAEKREKLRNAILPRLTSIFGKALPHLPPARIEDMVPVAMHMLKAVSEADSPSVAADITDLLTVYFSREGSR